MRSEQEANRAVERYADMVRRLCLVHLKNEADTGEERREVLAAVLSLPEKYRDAVYLLYYEGYRAPEIAKLLGKNVNTVYTLLTRARERLRELLGGEGDG